jgi:protein SCO1/2
MKSRTRFLIAFIALAISLAACSHHEAASTAVKRYPIEGEILSVNPSDQTAKIKHSEIKGWMGAMTMDYQIPGKNDLSKLHPGDHIKGTVFVQGEEFWVGDITEETTPSPAKQP